MELDPSDSPELGLHIHSLLHDYCITHCTTDYVSFTEDLVTEFIEGLMLVPLTDPHSLVIPADPFITFSKMHGLASLPPYDEIPQTTNEARLYLKKNMGAIVGPPKTDRVVQSDDYGQELPPPQPMYPALTRASRQKMPKLGANKESNRPEIYRDVINARGMDLIQIEAVQEPTLCMDEILQLGFKMDPEESSAVRTLLQSTVNMLRPQKGYKNRYFDRSFLCDDAPPSYEYLETDFVPIFPRALRPGSGITPSEKRGHCPRNFIDLQSVGLKKVTIDDPDNDIAMQNLVVVDGWETIRSSPPSTPSTNNQDDTEDQLDQLFLVSSPNTEPALIEDLKDAQMEVIQMPRSRKIGGNAGVAKHLLAGKTLATFLQPLFEKTPFMFDKKEPVEQHSSPDLTSLLGLPSSTLQCRGLDSQVHLEDDLDTELRRLYESGDLEDLIMNERIDNKEDLMMKVPDLPEPNVHRPNGMFVPQGYSDFLTPAESKGEQGRVMRASHQFLKKAKGRQSLALALSWVAFTVDEKLPTVAEIVGVAEIFEANSNLSLLAEVETLLRSMDLADCASNPTAFNRFLGEETSCGYGPPDLPDDFHILLNRNERLRLAKLEGRDGVPSGTSDEPVLVDEQEQPTDDLVDDIHRPAKRPRLSYEDGHLDLQCNSPQAIYDNRPTTFDPDFVLEPVLDEDKENWPPLSSSFPQVMDEAYDTEYYLPSQAPDDVAMQKGEATTELVYEGSNLPLYTESRDIVSSSTSSLVAEPNEHDIGCSTHLALDLKDGCQDLLMDALDNVLTPVASFNLENPSCEVLSVEPVIALHSLGINSFAHLRARRVSERPAAPMSDPNPVALPVEELVDLPPDAPKELYDSNTVSLPETVDIPDTVHVYMASVDLIQKQALVRSLRSRECCVDLVERESLNGADLIIDPHAAVIFVSLFALASQCAAFVDRVSQLSWKFGCLLVIFEAYPQSSCRKPSKKRRCDTASGLYAYTPPIMKAIKKFRRDLNIAEACGSKRPDAEFEVGYAFAATVDEGALLTRWFGNKVEEGDNTEGAIWGERAWLGVDYLEDEEATLSSLMGMNRFSASIVLCQVPLQEFLNLSPNERVQTFGRYIGVDTIVRFSAFS
ncbi:hypothetical protein B0H34DRAFT_3858 [Crassisporium funariophilum]|nr:hypothetical protein B0H34DRAFT_3858 [Crassisporium funariophilum]